MGRKRSWTWQYLYCCAAGLIVAMLAACAPLGPAPLGPDNTHLRLSRQLLAAGDFAGALRENQQLLALHPRQPPGDTALFNIGMIHIHHANPKKDPGKALRAFDRCSREFPNSPHADEARNWVHILQALAKMPRKDADSDDKSDDKMHGLPDEQANIELQRGRRLLAQGDLQGALQATRDALASSPHDPPGDEALFAMGLIHIHYANPKKDIGRAQALFTRVVKEFPDSPRTEEARIWVDILDAMEKTRQIDIEIEQKKRELRR